VAHPSVATHDESVAGASKQTTPVRVVNANWEAGEDGTDGSFGFMLVTNNEERHFVQPSATSAAALVSLFTSGAPLMWDPEARTLIAGGLVGTWFDPDRHARDE